MPVLFRFSYVRYQLVSMENILAASSCGVCQRLFEPQHPLAERFPPPPAEISEVSTTLPSDLWSLNRITATAWSFGGRRVEGNHFWWFWVAERAKSKRFSPCQLRYLSGVDSVNYTCFFSEKSLQLFLSLVSFSFDAFMCKMFETP